METEDFKKEVSIKITLGHLVFAWQVMSDKFSDLRSHETLSEEERRVIWGLADLLERALVENGVGASPEDDWETLVSSAGVYMNTVPVDFLE